MISISQDVLKKSYFFHNKQTGLNKPLLQQQLPAQTKRHYDEAQRVSLSMMTMKCADLLGMVSELPLADFWGRRIQEEMLRLASSSNTTTTTTTTIPRPQQQGSRIRAKAPGAFLTSPELDVEYYDGQIGFLENVILPMFIAFCTFTSVAFRDEVMERAGENLAAWWGCTSSWNAVDPGCFEKAQSQLSHDPFIMIPGFKRLHSNIQYSATLQ